MPKKRRSFLGAWSITSEKTWPAIHRAVYAGQVNVVKRLLAEGEDPNRVMSPANVGLTPLHAASLVGALKIARVLLEEGADVNAMTNWEGRAIDIAIQHGNSMLVELFLRFGADPNGRIDSTISATRPRTTLIERTIANDGPHAVRIVELLLDAGATVMPEMVDNILSYRSGAKTTVDAAIDMVEKTSGHRDLLHDL